jgi:hypothetical protein
MRKLVERNGLLLLVYGCLLICLASFFVIHESHLIHQRHHDLPVMFLARFGVFWFVSIMIAVVLYLAYLSYFHLFLKAPEKVLARRAGYLTFWLGVGGCILISLVLYFYYKYPQVFYSFL